MEVITKVLSYSRPDKFYIYPLGDLHTGVVHFDEELLKEKVQEIKSQKNTYWIGMGDYADLISPDDFKRWDGRILAEWMKGHEDNIGPTQCEHVDELLSPIWNKCLCLIEGNHDEEIRRRHHYNFMDELLKKANKKAHVPYGGVSCFVRLVFRRLPPENLDSKLTGDRHIYRIHARHGEGSARTAGARALSVLRLASSMSNSHIILMGHLHGQDSPELPQRIIEQNGKIKSFDSIAVMTGAWIQAYKQGVPPCYLERWGCPPSNLGCPSIVIEPDKGIMELKKTKKARDI